MDSSLCGPLRVPLRDPWYRQRSRAAHSLKLRSRSHTTAAGVPPRSARESRLPNQSLTNEGEIGAATEGCVRIAMRRLHLDSWVMNETEMLRTAEIIIAQQGE